MFYESDNPNLYSGMNLFQCKEFGLSVYGEGDPLLLLHGNYSSSKMFRKIAPLLAEHYKTITLDLPGHGDLPKYTFESAFQPECSYNHVLNSLRNLGIKELIVCGHDIGGAIGLMLAVNKEVFVKKLILINPHIFPGDRCYELMRMSAFPGASKEICLEVFWANVMGSGVVWNSFLDLRPIIRSLQVPVLELASESNPDSDDIYRDWLINSRSFTSGLNWTIRQIKAAGWYSTLEKPQEIARLILNFI